MKFTKVVLIGALLASAAPLALADRLYGQLSVGGTGIITATSITFSHPKPLPPKTAPGVVLDSNVDFSAFTLGQGFRYVAGTSGPAGANLVFATTTVAMPVLLYTVTESGVTLNLYLTNISSVVVGSATSTGSFTGTGYVTLTGHSGTTAVDFALTNSSMGAGEKSFSAELTAPTPEPNSLALLGTGVVGVAGMLFRKRKNG